MRQTDMRGAHPARARVVCERTSEAQLWRTTRVGDDFDLSQPTPADPRVQRLETRFLGREARGERLDAVSATGAAGELLRGEDPGLDPLERPRPAADVDQIQPDSDDHAPRAANGILGCVTRRTEGVSAAAITCAATAAPSG